MGVSVVALSSSACCNARHKLLEECTGKGFAVRRTSLDAPLCLVLWIVLCITTRLAFHPSPRPRYVEECKRAGYSLRYVGSMVGVSFFLKGGRLVLPACAACRAACTGGAAASAAAASSVLPPLPLPGPTHPRQFTPTQVADVHRTLLYGGIFMYPADKKNPKVCGATCRAWDMALSAPRARVSSQACTGGYAANRLCHPPPHPPSVPPRASYACSTSAIPWLSSWSRQ